MGQTVPPLRGHRSGPKYQVSTERETLTTSEDDSSVAINAPYIRITEPQSGRKSLVESLQSKKAKGQRIIWRMPDQISKPCSFCTGGKSGGETNQGFVPSADDKASFTVETEKAEKKEAEKRRIEEEEERAKKEIEKEEKKEEDPPPPSE